MVPMIPMVLNGPDRPVGFDGFDDIGGPDGPDPDGPADVDGFDYNNYIDGPASRDDPGQCNGGGYADSSNLHNGTRGLRSHPLGSQRAQPSFHHKLCLLVGAQVFCGSRCLVPTRRTRVPGGPTRLVRSKSGSSGGFVTKNSCEWTVHTYFLNHNRRRTRGQ